MVLAVWSLLRPLSLAGRWSLSHLIMTSVVFPVCSHIPDVSLYVQISFSYENTAQIRLSLTQMSCCNLIISLKAPSPNTVTS